MAVRPSSAADPVQVGANAPIRTCIGCRHRAAATELLRVVAVSGSVIPDPRRRAPGRGAYLHPVPECVALAERRRAFARALRVSGTLDPAPVRDFVARSGFDRFEHSTGGTPQEI